MNETLFPIDQTEKTKERLAYERLQPHLQQCLAENHAPADALQFTELKNYASITFLNDLICSFRFGKKAQYIRLPEYPYRNSTQTPPAENRKDGFYRIELKSWENISDHIPLIQISLEHAIYNQSKEFDICHLYNECSDAKRCVGKPEISLSCGYKRIIKSGRIFYGKNRNID